MTYQELKPYLKGAITIYDKGGYKEVTEKEAKRRLVDHIEGQGGARDSEICVFLK